MISDERIADLEARIRARPSKPDKDARAILALIARLRATHAALEDVIEHPIPYSRVFTVEDLAERALQTAERRLRKAGRIK